MKRSHLFFACLLFIGTHGFAQQYPFVYYTPKDGLINSRVKSIRQDHRGFMYFITRGGLSVYDGARFSNYSLKEGLANDLVNDVIEITPDSLLVATNTNALNTLVHGTVGVFKTADRFCPIINRFFRSTNGDLYAAADEGLFVLTGNRFVRVPLLNKENKEIGRYLEAVTGWKNYLLLIPWNSDLKENLVVYDTLKKLVIATETQRVINSITVDKQGLVWITTKEQVGILDTLALKKGNIIINDPPPTYETVSNMRNAAALFDGEGNKWFFNRERLQRFTTKGGDQIISSKQGLNVKNLSNLFVDREGILWIATDGYGVAKLANSGVELLNTLNETPVAITAMMQDGYVTWLSNAADNSIYRVDKTSTTVFPFSQPRLNIVNICSYHEKLYVVANDKLVCVANRNDPAAYQHPEVIFSEPNLRLGNAVIDPYGNIIIQINKEDVSYYTYVISNKKVIYKFTNKTIGDQAALDRSGRLWLITRKGQLLVFSLHPESSSHYLRLLKDYSGALPHLDPRSIMIDNHNNVWIGTRYRGIYYLKLNDLKLDSVIKLNTGNGLTDNFVYALACDNTGNIWAGTQTGLDKIIRKNNHYIVENVSRNNNFFQTIYKIIITDDNTAWALSGEGTILKISPAATTHVESQPQLVMREMKVDNIPFRAGRDNFSYKQNNFSFSVAAPSFLDEKSIQYSYLLEGSGNDKWSEPTNQSVFNFINLSPAHYTLKVKCDFPEKRYASQMVSYPFVIHPPWWQTMWFLVLAAVLIVGTLFIIIRIYYNRKWEKAKTILEKQQAVERERTRISIDMHDDLGAGLSRIKFLSETIGIKKQREEPIEDDINKIRNYSHEMIDKMGEIVWALNEKNDSLSDLLSYTRSYAVEYLSQSGIRCEVDAPDTFPTDFVSGEFRRNIYLVVKEALHNIVKHAQASEVKLKIMTGHQLEICISDDGIGFDRKNIRPFSNGLSNMEKRITGIGGSFLISTEEGTTIHIKAPFKA